MTQFQVYGKEKKYLLIKHRKKFRAGSNWSNKNYLSLNDLLWKKNIAIAFTNSEIGIWAFYSIFNNLRFNMLSF
jgi:hypothetical protein